MISDYFFDTISKMNSLKLNFQWIKKSKQPQFINSLRIFEKFLEITLLAITIQIFFIAYHFGNKNKQPLKHH